MDRKPSLKLIRTKILFCVYLLFTFSVSAQEWHKVDSLVLPYKISSYAIDQEGKIYLGSHDGDIFRYGPDGKEDKVYSGINFSSVTTIEPWNRLKLFLFYRENQTIVYLDRFVATATSYQLGNLGTGFNSLATIGVDNSFWVLESGNGELRKYSNNKNLIFATPINTINLVQASHIRAFQNLVILLDSSSGFHLFDQFGNPISTVSVIGADYFHIFNKQVITYDGKQVIEFDPFNPSTITGIVGPKEKYLGVLKSKDHYLFIQENRVVKYQLK